MNILLVTADLPYPPNQGGRIRMFNLLKYLANGHDIHLVSVAFSRLSDADHEMLSRYCRTIAYVDQPGSPWFSAVCLAKSLLGRKPFIVCKHMSPALTDQVRSVAKEKAIDVILTVSPYLVESVMQTELPRIVDLHHIDSILYERFAGSPKWNLKKIHGMVQLAFIRQFEESYPAQFDRCVTVSDEDAAILREISDCRNTAVVPNGVDLRSFVPQPNTGQQNDLVFIGSLDYFPNIDALGYLYHEIMPVIWKQRPDTTLAIVGRNPPRAVEKFAEDPRIEVTGTVPDIRPYLHGAAVVMIPLRMGSGTRIKALEAGALEKAMVGTSLAFEGLDFEDGIHALIADDAHTLARAACELLENEGRRAALGSAVRDLVAERYDWAVSGALFEKIIFQVCAGEDTT